MIRQPAPDSKDWTWVLREPCPECGFDCSSPDRSALADLIAAVGDRWVVAVRDRDDIRLRPAPAVWSPLEYSCHVRDVFGLATYRLQLMLDEDAPSFANWDQDATAIADDYASQDPDEVLDALSAAARQFAQAVAVVPEAAWERTGLRSDGAVFTVESFVRYLVHDPVHHLTDVTGDRWV